jgi:hypothetical protein
LVLSFRGIRLRFCLPIVSWALCFLPRGSERYQISSPALIRWAFWPQMYRLPVCNSKHQSNPPCSTRSQNAPSPRDVEKLAKYDIHNPRRNRRFVRSWGKHDLQPAAAFTRYPHVAFPSVEFPNFQPTETRHHLRARKRRNLSVS